MGLQRRFSKEQSTVMQVGPERTTTELRGLLLNWEVVLIVLGYL